MKKLPSLLLLSLPLLATAQDYQQHYKIYNTKNKQLISVQSLVKDAAKTDILFFGEEHDDSIGHRLEADIFKQLNDAHPRKVALSMEMFHTDVQTVMNEYLLGLIAEKNLVTEGRAWKNYKDYKPMVEYAKQNGLNVIAANAPTRYTNAVTRSGLEILEQLPPESKKYLPKLPIDTATGRYYQKFLDIMEGHTGLQKIYQSQNVWDATMAWSIASYHKKHKKDLIFQVNGRFHSDEKLGTLAQLKKRSPELKILNISCFYDDSFVKPDWDKFKDLGDFVIITDPSVKKTF